MSTEQSDPQLIEETKRQIRGLVFEITQLSKQSHAPLEFYTEFLNRVVQALLATGGAIWTLNEGNRLDLIYQINLQSTGLLENPGHQQRHGRILQQVLRSGEGLLVAPHSGAGGDGEAANPTDHLLVLGPLKSDQEVKGVVEIFQRPDTNLRAQRGYLNFLMQMCEVAGDYLKTRQLRQFSDRQLLWSQLESFTRMVHASLDPRETAYTIVNEGRRLIDCDRVSVALRKGRRSRIEAVSGQDTFDKRSNTISLLNELATAVIRTGEPMWYTGDTSDMPPQVEAAVQAYVDDSHSKTVAVLPLLQPGTDEDKETRRETLGALIVEQIESARPRDGMEQRVSVVAEHSSAALANAIEYHSLFLLPVWRAMGRAKWIIEARTLPKTLLIVAAVGIAIGFMCLFPYDFELQGKGKAMPVIRNDVFASHDGTVVKSRATHADPVKKDDVLAELRNNELDVQVLGVLGEMDATEEKIKSLEQMTYDQKLPTDQKARISGELRGEKEKASGLKKQMAILRDEQQELFVHSPITGQVITWDLERVLNRRHVSRGQRIMEVADPSGPWELEVMMPEDRMGHIARARKELGDPLIVSYRQHNDPSGEHTGEVREVHLNAEVRGEEGNTVLLRVAIDKNQLTDLRPGAGVTVRVHCGKRPIGYVWFHDVLAWIHSNVLFRL